MSIAAIPSHPAAAFARAARRVIGVMFRSVSAGIERVATSERELSSEYYRFPWF